MTKTAGTIETKTYPINSLGWLAEQLNLSTQETIPLLKRMKVAIAVDALATTIIAQDKVDALLATKQGRDTTLKLAAAAPQQEATQEDQEQPKGGDIIATETRRLTLSEVRGIAKTAGVTQQLVKDLDLSCFTREEELHALRGYQREERLIEADSAGRLIARLKHSDRLNDELDSMEVELAENTSRTSDLSKRLFGVNLQTVIDAQADAEQDRVEARQAWQDNFKKHQEQEAAISEGKEIPEDQRLGEDVILDPWATARQDLSGLGVRRTSKLKRRAF
jgi:hypothetical protein